MVSMHGIWSGPRARKVVRRWLFSMVIFALLVPGVASAQETPWPEACEESTLGEQLILICVPEDWVGPVVMYAHGYVAPQEPLDLPRDELLRWTLPGERSVIDIVLSLRFAFITTSYSKNGYAVEAAESDLIALIEHFEATQRPPSKVLLTGASEGGLIGVMMAEKHPDRLDGVLAMCGPIGGAPSQVSYVGDFRVVFDYFFPEIFDFGAADVPPDAYQDWESVYEPAIESALLGNPLQRAQLFNVTDAAMVPTDPDTAVETAHTLLRYSVVGTNDLVELAGVMPYDNVDTRYQGSLLDFRLNRRVERIDGDPAYLSDFYQTTGDLERPVVALHTLLDGGVPFRHEVSYRALVEEQGDLDNLTILPVARYGHCNFTPREVLGAFGLLFLQTELPGAESLSPLIESLPQPME